MDDREEYFINRIQNLAKVDNQENPEFESGIKDLLQDVNNYQEYVDFLYNLVETYTKDKILKKVVTSVPEGILPKHHTAYLTDVRLNCYDGRDELVYQEYPSIQKHVSIFLLVVFTFYTFFEKK